MPETPRPRVGAIHSYRCSAFYLAQHNADYPCDCVCHLDEPGENGERARRAQETRTGSVEVTVKVVAPLTASSLFTADDLFAAVTATLHEVFPVDDGAPVVPTVERVR